MGANQTERLTIGEAAVAAGVAPTALRYYEREGILQPTARTDKGLIMGLRHKELLVEGVQFHPESIMTSVGHDLLRNFLNTVEGWSKQEERTS